MSPAYLVLILLAAFVLAFAWDLAREAVDEEDEERARGPVGRGAAGDAAADRTASEGRLRRLSRTLDAWVAVLVAFAVLGAVEIGWLALAVLL